MMNLDFNHIRPINGTANDGLKNLYANWHAKRRFHAKRNTYGMVNPMVG